MFILNDRVFDVLKWCDLVLIPAAATAYVGLSSVWGWPYADEIAKTAAVVCTLLGALLGISTAQYHAQGTITKTYPPDTKEITDDNVENPAE